jgi:hypothetical protein
MTLWLAVAGAFAFGVVVASAVSVRRYARHHLAGGVREPRRPPGLGPLAASVKLQPPGC